MGQGATKWFNSPDQNKRTGMSNVDKMAAVPKKPVIPSLQHKRSTFRGTHEFMSEERLPSTESNTESSGLSQSTSENSLYSSKGAEPKTRGSQLSRPRTNSRGSIHETRSGTHTPIIIEDKLQKTKKKKEVRRAEIVAAVTRRLYSNSKKPELYQAEPTPIVVEELKEEEEVEPEELKLCANARARLQEITKKAMNTRKIKQKVDAEIQTESETHVLRVKEVGISTDTNTYINYCTKHNQIKNVPSHWFPPLPFYLVDANKFGKTRILVTQLPSQLTQLPSQLTQLPSQLTQLPSQLVTQLPGRDLSDTVCLKDVYLQSQKNKILSSWTSYSETPVYDTYDKFVDTLQRTSNEEYFSDDSLDYQHEENYTDYNKPCIKRQYQYSSSKSFIGNKKFCFENLSQQPVHINATTGTQTFCDKASGEDSDQISRQENILGSLFQSCNNLNKTGELISVYTTEDSCTQTVFSCTKSMQTESHNPNYVTTEITLYELEEMLQDCDCEIPITITEKLMIHNKNDSTKLMLSVSENLTCDMIPDIKDITETINKSYDSNSVQTDPLPIESLPSDTMTTNKLDKTDTCEQCKNQKAERNIHDIGLKINDNKIYLKLSNDNTIPLIQCTLPQQDDTNESSLCISYSPHNDHDDNRPCISLSLQNEEREISSADIQNVHQNSAREINNDITRSNNRKSNNVSSATESNNSHQSEVACNQNNVLLLNIIKLIFIALIRYPSVFHAASQIMPHQAQNNASESNQNSLVAANQPSELSLMTGRNARSTQSSVELNDPKYSPQNYNSNANNLKSTGAFPKYKNNLNSYNTKMCNDKFSMKKRYPVHESQLRNSLGQKSLTQSKYDSDDDDFDSSENYTPSLPRSTLGICNREEENLRDNSHPRWDDIRNLILGRNKGGVLEKVNSKFDAEMRNTRRQRDSAKIQKSVSWNDIQGDGALHTEIIDLPRPIFERREMNSRLRPILRGTHENMTNKYNTYSLENDKDIYNNTEDENDDMYGSYRRSRPYRRWSITYPNDYAAEETLNDGTSEDLTQLTNLLKEAKSLVQNLNQTSGTTQSTENNSLNSEKLLDKNNKPVKSDRQKNELSETNSGDQGRDTESDLQSRKNHLVSELSTKYEEDTQTQNEVNESSLTRILKDCATQYETSEDVDNNLTEKQTSANCEGNMQSKNKTDERAVSKECSTQSEVNKDSWNNSSITDSSRVRGENSVNKEIEDNTEKNNLKECGSQCKLNTNEYKIKKFGSYMDLSNELNFENIQENDTESIVLMENEVQSNKNENTQKNKSETQIERQKSEETNQVKTVSLQSLKLVDCKGTQTYTGVSTIEKQCNIEDDDDDDDDDLLQEKTYRGDSDSSDDESEKVSEYKFNTKLQLSSRRRYHKLYEKVNEIENNLNQRILDERETKRYRDYGGSRKWGQLIENSTTNEITAIPKCRIDENYVVCGGCRMESLEYENCAVSHGLESNHIYDYIPRYVNSVTNLTHVKNCALCNNSAEALYKGMHINRTKSMPNVSAHHCHGHNIQDLSGLQCYNCSGKYRITTFQKNYERRLKPSLTVMEMIRFRYQSPKAYLQYLIEMRRMVIQKSLLDVERQNINPSTISISNVKYPP